MKGRGPDVALDLAFEAEGADDAPPVLILHGLYGSGRNWRSVARALAPERRVFTVDLRNHGASPWKEAMGYLEMADDVRRLIQRQGLQRPALVGHSMGGKVAMAVALMYPDEIARPVVVDIAPVAYADRVSMFAEAMRAVDTLGAASREEVRQRLSERVDDAGIVGFLMQNLEVRNAHFDWRLNLGAILASIGTLCDFPSALRTLRYTRTLAVISGSHSDYVSADGAEFAPMFGQVELQRIDGAGHWVHADRPEAFIAALQRALACGSAAGALP